MRFTWMASGTNISERLWGRWPKGSYKRRAPRTVGQEKDQRVSTELDGHPHGRTRWPTGGEFNGILGRVCHSP